jgi:hypothetical protein
MHGLYDMVDMAIAEELGVDVETYIRIIETKCSMREANYIINVVFGERTDKLENAKAIFNKYLNEEGDESAGTGVGDNTEKV